MIYLSVLCKLTILGVFYEKVSNHFHLVISNSNYLKIQLYK